MSMARVSYEVTCVGALGPIKRRIGISYDISSTRHGVFYSRRLFRGLNNEVTSQQFV